MTIIGDSIKSKVQYIYVTNSLMRMTLENLKIGINMKLTSDIKDVVYINFLVNIENIHPDILPSLPILDIGGKTIFTILTYKHGNLRPSFVQSLKWLFPSPLQSNWRFYLEEKESIFFTKNLLSSKTVSVMAKYMSQSMDVLYKKDFTHSVKDESISTTIDKRGLALFDMASEVSLSNTFTFPLALLEHFKSDEAILSFLCNQKYAYNEVAKNVYCKSQIKLEYEYSSLEALDVRSFKSEWIEKNFGEVEVFAFLMPKVLFQTLNEKVYKETK